MPPGQLRSGGCDRRCERTGPDADGGWHLSHPLSLPRLLPGDRGRRLDAPAPSQDVRTRPGTRPGRRRSDVRLAGRKYYGGGELFEYDLYSSVVTATRPDDTPLFTEKLVAQPWRQPVRHAGAMGKFDVFANVTLVTPRHHADRIFEQAGAGADAECMADASRLPNEAALATRSSRPRRQPSSRRSTRSGLWSARR